MTGSISYFPLADGSKIITKQLQTDGTSKTVIYQMLEGDNVAEKPKYITVEDLNAALGKINMGDYRKDFEDIREQIQQLADDIRDINEKINSNRRK